MKSVRSADGEMRGRKRRKRSSNATQKPMRDDFGFELKYENLVDKHYSDEASKQPFVSNRVSEISDETNSLLPKKVKVNFLTKKDVDDFAQLVRKKLTSDTKEFVFTAGSKPNQKTALSPISGSGRKSENQLIWIVWKLGCGLICQTLRYAMNQSFSQSLLCSKQRSNLQRSRDW